MNILPMARTAPAPIDDVETIRRRLEILKSAKLRDAEAAVATIRAERASTAAALRSACAAHRQRPTPTDAAAITAAESELAAIDRRLAEARRARDAARKPLAAAVTAVVAPHYGEAAGLVREAAEAVDAARRILLVIEDFAARNAISRVPLASLLPANLSAVATELDRRQ